MRKQFIKAVGDLQELFQELYDQGKIEPDQADRFNKSQKEIINYDAWSQNKETVKLKVKLPWDDPEFESAWVEWKEYLRKKYVFTYYEASERFALEGLQKIANKDVGKAIEIIKQSISAGWKRFFELPADKQKKNNSSRPGQILTTDNAKEYDGWD